MVRANPYIYATEIGGVAKRDWNAYTTQLNNAVRTNANGVEWQLFNVLNTPIANAEGLLQWNATDGTLDLGMSGGAITQQIGQELFMKVRNVSGATIPNGSPVYASGRTGNRPNIYLARSDSETTSNFIGLTTQDIASPADGFVTTFGLVRGIKTNYSGAGDWGTTWTAGDRLYISKTVAGQLTNVEHSAPHHSDTIGTVEVVGALGIGSILVNPAFHKTLEELSDVNGTALTTTGQMPVWDNTNKYFDFNYNITDYQRLLRTVTVVTDTYNVLATDQVIVCNKATAFTVTLPASPVTGQFFIIKNIGAGTVTIEGNGTDTIDLELTQAIYTGESAQVICYANNSWLIV